VKERRQVMMYDVPGAFMQVDVDEVVYVRLVGKASGTAHHAAD
jgi:hypothetical protein